MTQGLSLLVSSMLTFAGEKEPPIRHIRAWQDPFLIFEKVVFAAERERGKPRFAFIYKKHKVLPEPDMPHERYIVAPGYWGVYRVSRWSNNLDDWCPFSFWVDIDEWNVQDWTNEAENYVRNNP